MDVRDITTAAMASPRSLVCHYNPSMVAAALVVSLLGAFTSTQLMSQARGARSLSGVLIWTILGCLTFGFCGTWCLHFLGMLSCEFDVPIGLNFSLTALSAVLAVSFTFGALSTDLIQKYCRRPIRKQVDVERNLSNVISNHLESDLEIRQSSEALLRPSFDAYKTQSRKNTSKFTINGSLQDPEEDYAQHRASNTEALLSNIGDNSFTSQQRKDLPLDGNLSRPIMPPTSMPNQNDYDDTNSEDILLSTAGVQSRSSLDNAYHRAGTTMINSQETNSIQEQGSTPSGNMLLSAFNALINNFTLANIFKGFIWSIALTNMHFMGVKALEIPGGFVTLDPARIILCALISWSVCCVGVILMADMEVNIKQQVLFSFVAASGVAAVHFSGMYACSFYSMDAPSPKRGYPIELPIVIACVAIFTCMVCTGLLAHSATIARDKLAGVLYTRRRLWAALAQKENAEAAAAARSEFIASASHEIRTPLHQLQGYADLLSKSELSEEDRLLLLAIQHATRSLAMITSNVLDWSRLEKGEAICRPIAVDIRHACEAVIHVLPNSDDNVDTELVVAVAPEVPQSVFVDETFLQRILMNLLSNSFKFTTSGYVMLLLRLNEGILQITVADSGTGIPKSFLPQLFEPYKQVQARGAERGTGLGLSITKRLLQRMQGSVLVESKYQLDQGVGVANSGSVFTLTIPIVTLENSSDHSPFDLAKPLRVGIMHTGNNRDIEGIATAWTLFGADVLHIKETTDISSDPEMIIWADLSFLRTHQHFYLNVLRKEPNLVLVPYKDKSLLDKILGPSPPINIVPIRKPLIWHRIVQTIVDARKVQNSSDDILKIVPGNEIEQRANKSKKQAPEVNKKTILLVEDNKINQVLGAKTLTMLNYDVLVAVDGQEAIDIIKEHSETIDAILMDQSMPVKDGITATKEIRELEAAGLCKRQIIIAVTAAAGPESRSQFLEAGTDIFLAKPLSMAKLEQTLSRYFDG